MRGEGGGVALLGCVRPFVRYRRGSPLKFVGVVECNNLDQDGMQPRAVLYLPGPREPYQPSQQRGRPF